MTGTSSIKVESGQKLIDIVTQLITELVAQKGRAQAYGSSQFKIEWRGGDPGDLEIIDRVVHKMK